MLIHSLSYAFCWSSEINPLLNALCSVFTYHLKLFFSFQGITLFIFISYISSVFYNSVCYPFSIKVICTFLLHSILPSFHALLHSLFNTDLVYVADLYSSYQTRFFSIPLFGYVIISFFHLIFYSHNQLSA